MTLLKNTWQWLGRTDSVEGEMGLRWHQVVKKDMTDNLSQTVTLLGFNCDEGVVRNHGRVGAAQGADAVRAMLGTLDRVGPDVHDILESVSELATALQGLPGVGLLQRRGERKADEEEEGSD